MIEGLLEQLRKMDVGNLMPNGQPDMRHHKLADAIEDAIDDEIGDFNLNGYPKPFSTTDAMHMVLGTAADFFETPEEAIAYMRGETSIELPVDKDGVPIHIGDKVIADSGCGRAEGVNALRMIGDELWVGVGSGSRSTRPCTCRHAKPRTVEDVLVDFAHNYNSIGGKPDETELWEKLLTDTADELLELMGRDDG